MAKGGTLFTMSYYGSQMVVQNYNVMGVARRRWRRGPLHGSRARPEGHPGACDLARTALDQGCLRDPGIRRCSKGEAAPRLSLVRIEYGGIVIVFLAHDAARLITGETLYVDGGYHIID